MAGPKDALVLYARDRRRLEGLRSAQERLDARKRLLVVELRDKGASLRELGDALGVSHGTVLNWLREAQERDERP